MLPCTRRRRVLRKRYFGESHSPVVHELWVLVVAGSNPASPTTAPFLSGEAGFRAFENALGASRCKRHVTPRLTTRSFVGRDGRYLMPFKQQPCTHVVPAGHAVPLAHTVTPGSHSEPLPAQ